MDVVRHYVIVAKMQQNPFAKNYNSTGKMVDTNVVNVDYFTKITNIIQCTFTPNVNYLLMYLKIPEYLPSRKEGREDDGNIVFVNSTCNDGQLVSPQFNWKPQVGDFFIFPAQQSHFVYPFRTADGKGERRSVSFNAIFSTEREVKEQQENHKKQMEEFQKQNKKIYRGDIPTLSMKNEEKSEVKRYEGDVGKFHQS